MYEEKLEKIGLNKSQAKIYSLLINSGALKGSEIAKEIKISRQLTYKHLDELSVLDLIQKKDEKGSAAKFEITHPSKLENLLNNKEEEIKKARKELDLTIENLTSDYNLLSGQPGVQVFEGEEGVIKVLNDSLKTKGEILTYADIEAIMTKIKHLQDNYAKERNKLKIKKRALILDTPFAQKYMKDYSSNITDTRFISNSDIKPFSAFVEIYDDKISYITFEDNKMIGIIIQNKAISDINKYLFEFAWKNSKKI